MIRLASISLDRKIEDIIELRKDDFFMMGLAYASEDLYKAFLELEKQSSEEKKNKILDSVYRYVQRSKYRATPFALFAGTTLARLDKETHLGSIKREIDIDLDHKILWNKTHKLLCKNLKNRDMPVGLNSTITEYEDNIHYVKFHSKKNVFKQVQLGKNILVDYLLKERENIRTIGDILDLEEKYEDLKDVNIPQYMEELVKINLIAFALFPNTKLYSQTNNLLTNLAVLGINHHSKIPEKISLEELKKFPDKKIRKEWGIKKKEKLSNLYKVRLSNKVENAKLNLTNPNNLKEAVLFLFEIQGYRKNENLEKLANDIESKFGEVEQPILNLFDPSIGVKYSTGEDWMLKGKKPLLKKLILRDKEESNVKTDLNSELNHFLANKLENYYSGKLEDIDLSEFKPSSTVKNRKKQNRFPKDFSLFVENYEKKKQVFLKFIGSPGQAIMSRFLEETIQEPEKLKNTKEEDFVFAEIIYFPRVKTGNILNRPRKHKYEVWINDYVPQDENILRLEDLSVFQCQGSVFIKSNRLNKFIIPILNTAYNAKLAIPIYQFFHEYSKSFHLDFMWNWGSFSLFKRLPRLRYKNVILSKKNWRVKKEDFDSYFQNPSSECFDEAVKALKLDHSFNLSLKSADNFLSLDIRKETDRRLFLRELKTKKEVEIKENLCSDSDGIKVGGEFYANEMLLPMHYKEEQNLFFNATLEKSRGTNYLPGSDYSYMKIYVDENNANTVIRSFLSPLVRQNNLKEWHFVRYFDSKGDHIRFRFRKNKLSVDDFLAYYQKHKNPMIHSIVVDTFYPEYKRYGFLNYDFTEKLFELDSNACLSFFSMDESKDEIEQIKFALANIYSYLLSFYDKKAILLELKTFSNNLKSEFEIDTVENNKKINELYRDLQGDLESYKTYLPMLKERENFIEKENKKEFVIGRLWSYTHMCINRIFDYKFRLQEAIVYDLLRIITAKELFSKKEQKEKV